jgi:negative regulator of sigma-B (phosphoserine phosphatase)
VTTDRFSVVRPRTGETACGDGVLVREGEGRTMLAVVDALGHGPLAGEVTATALACLSRVALSGGPAAMQHELHAALRGTRGAAAMICVLEGGRITGCGVGNVELRTSPTSVPVILSPGILGSGVRAFRAFEGAAPPGTRIALFSDGISASRLSLEAVRNLDAESACRAILERCGYAHDDAAILIADVRAS